ncbi:MAG: IS3 family transposase [Chloroflexi bacterium]|nr:IS3 family transposase [Chloroflexota bacterium]
MQQHSIEFSIERMSCVFNVSRSGFYKFLKAIPSDRKKVDELLLVKIKNIHQESRQTYGSPRIHAELISKGDICSRKRICRLMKKSGIQAKMKKRFKITTKASAKAIAAPNLLQQDFTAVIPNQSWVADITYIATAEGWLYLSAIVDLFSRRIVGLAMSERITTELISAALNQALTHRKPAAGLVHHSDKGCQYTSIAFQKLLKTHGIVCSMSGAGNCYDNAAMESFFHTLKTEHTYFEHYETREQAKQSIFEYVEIFYNNKRRHSTLGYLPPSVFEKQWYQQRNISLPCVH